MHNLAKNLSFNVIATLSTLVFGIATSIITARGLGPSDLGLLNFVMWLFMTILLLVDPGMNSATEKFVAEFEGADQRAAGNTLTQILLGCQVAIGLVVGGLLTLGSGKIAQLLGQPAAQPYVVLLAPAIPITLALGILRSRLAGLQQYYIVSIGTALGTCVTFVGTVLLLKAGFGIHGLVVLTTSINGLQLCGLLWLVWRQQSLWPQTRLAVPMVRRIAGYCLAVFLNSSLDAIIWQRSETFFLARYSTADQIGYYGLAYTIAGVLITTVPASFMALLLPALSQRFGAHDPLGMQRIYQKSIMYLALLVLPIALGGIAIAAQLIQLCYGHHYLPVVPVLQVLLLSSTIGLVAAPAGAVILALGKPSVATVWIIPAALVDIGLAWVYVPTYGAVGAAIASAACKALFVAGCTTYLIVREAYSFPLGPFIRIAGAASASAGCAYLLVQQRPDWLGMVSAIVCAAALYGPALYLTKSLPEADIAWLQQQIINRSALLKRRLRRFGRSAAESNV